MKLKNKKIIEIGICMLYLLILFPKIGSSQSPSLILNPSEKNLVQRCFIEYDGKKRTECVAVGDISGIHYAIDISNGSIINVWRGGFIDVTTMWTDRGELQLAIPLGKKIILSDIPTFSLSKASNQPSSNSAQDNLSFKGYSLNSENRPIFQYRFNNCEITDKTEPGKDYKGLNRELKFNGPIESVFNTTAVLAEATKIEKINKNLYAINNQEYYILIDEKKHKVTLQNNQGKESLISIPNKGNSIQYSILW